MSEKPGRLWSREETIIVFALYYRIPFAKSSKEHPEIKRIARIIGRSPSSVNMKIGNFGSLDPQLKESGIVGLDHASALNKEIWNEFVNNWEELFTQAFEFEQEMFDKKELLPDDMPCKIHHLGEDKMRLTSQRINQSFFRQTILAAYNESCCITGINIPQVLIASHIKPWAKCAPAEKLSPYNRLCLNALHDRAFDRGLITLDEKYKVQVSNQLIKSNNKAVKDWLVSFDGKEINLPARFKPSADFISWHRQHVFNCS